MGKNDIVITKVGTPCFASVISEYKEIALSRTVLGLTCIHDIDPYYLMTFLRCQYGFGQLYRQRELTIQYQLTLPGVKVVDVFIPSLRFQYSIANLIKSYQKTLHNSCLMYQSAQSLLLSKLNIVFTSISAKGTTEKSMSESFGSTGRLDAEYYQPKYEDICTLLKTTETVESLCHIYDTNFIPKSNIEYRYDCALCSTGFYVLASDRINSETLLVLFQSEPIQALLRQRCSGTILTAISKDEFLNMPLPVINDNVQREISEKVQEAFSLRRRAEDLIQTAIRAVEIAIESDEAAALKWIEETLHDLKH